MKYRALLTGNNKTIINEFFTYMDFSFECISTSDRYDDIMNHIKYLQPDVFVYCLYKENPDDMKRFINIESKISDRKIPLVIIGDAVDCNQFLRMGPFLEPLVLQKPITSQSIADSIVAMLDKKQSSKVAAVKKAQQNLKEKIHEDVDGLISQLKKPEEKSKKHILVVDDDSRVLRLLKDYLTMRYDVATAINGKVALKFLETKTTDLVLLDYEMPDENGAAVLEKLRANEKTTDLPVIFLTGVTDRDKIREVLTLKPQGYLLKPIDMEKLSSTIKGVLD